jgi:hypothetical protein
VRKVDVANIAKFFEHVQRTVNGTGTHAGQKFDHAVGRNRSGLPRQNVDHLATGFANSTISRAQHLDGLFLHWPTSLPHVTLPAAARRDLLAGESSKFHQVAK